MADRNDDVTEEVSSSQGQQTHEVGESSRPPQTEDEIFRTQLVTAVAMFTQVMQNPRFMAFLQPLHPSQSIENKKQKSEPAKAQPQVIHTALSMETPVHLPETMQSPNIVHNAQEQVAETPVLQAAPVQPATFQQPLVGSNGQGSNLQAMQQDEGLGKRLAHGYPYLEAEVAYCARNEYCETAVDFIARRSRLAFLDTKAAAKAIPRVVEILACEHKWDKARKKLELRRASEFLKTFKASENARFDDKH
ncbi:hypothetical protein L7F22_058390 [Adiantum nelumboides]|nr:hypothetical protein [Adiantum nelumboides]